MTQKAIIQTVGKNVKALRQSQLTPEGKRSINKFAEWAGVPNGTVDRIERGKTDPQLSHLLKIAAKYEAYGVRIWHLFVSGLDPLDLPAYLTSKEKHYHTEMERSFAELQAIRTGSHKYVPPS